MSKPNETRTLIIDYIIISLGVLIYTWGWQEFVVPVGISGGGLVGLCTILNYATGIPIYLYFAVINAFLLVIGTIVLGRGFSFKTIYSIILSTIFFAILPKLSWVGNIGSNTIPAGDPAEALKFLVNPIIGGFVCAFGIASVFKRRGSTGGTDILALIINKFYDVSPGKVFMYADFCIVASILLLPQKHLSDVIFGYIFTISFSYMVDLILTGTQQSVQLQIFSSKYEKVADMLMIEKKRGVTAISSVGWYSKKESKVLVVIARKNQLTDLTRAIKNIDSGAFIAVESVHAVYGQGFDEIKSGISKKSTKESKIKRIKKWLDGE